MYGSGQTGGDYAGVIPISIEQALSGEDITVDGDGKQTRDLVYVEDVVRANIAAAITDEVGYAYNIGTGNSDSIRELAETIRELTDSESDIVHINPRDGDIEKSMADISRARAKLNNHPSVNLE